MKSQRATPKCHSKKECYQCVLNVCMHNSGSLGMWNIDMEERSCEVDPT